MDADTVFPLNSIEDDEIVDFDLGEEKINSTFEEVLIDKSIFTVDSLFIVIYEEDDSKYDKLLLVTNINYEDGSIKLEDENKNNEELYFDTDDKLILNHAKYKIIEIEKIEEFLDDIDDIELLHTDDIYDDVEILVDEIEDKIYSEREKKENLMDTLIHIFKAYNDEIRLFEISEMVEQLMKMYRNSDDYISDTSDTLHFIKNMERKKPFEIPKWLIPIVENQKKLYLEDEGPDDEEGDENKDTFTRVFKDEIVDKYNMIQSLEDNNYKKVIEILFSYKPYRNNATTTIPYYGHYLRNCKDGCSGKNGDLSFDLVRTRDELKIPKIKDGYSSLETIIPKEQISFVGFHALSHLFLDVALVPSSISLHELYFLSDYKYSYINLKERLKKTTEHIITEDTKNGNDDLKKTIHSYIFQKKDLSYEEITNILKENIPSYSQLINSIPEFIQDKIYNYSDFKRAYLCYNLQYSDLDVKNRDIVNKMIETNIKNYIRSYNKSVKRRVIKQVPKKKKIITTKEKISLSRSFIMGIPVIPLRNNYIKKFINVFSRNPKANENQNFFYEKSTNDKLLCKHYLYAMDIHKNNESFNTLRSVYGGEIEDGFITCKFCKEYICSEDFSILEGFSDGIPTLSKEVLDNSDDELKILTEKQSRIKKRIQKISSLFGVDLNQYDKQLIIEYYDLFNNEKLIDVRYDMKKAFDNHPKVKEIKGSYKFVKPAKTQKDRVNNKKNKELMVKELSLIKEYFLDCNELFIDTFFILFLIQISDSSYQINSKISIDIWNLAPEDSWDDIKTSKLSKISMDTVGLITILMKKMIRYNLKDRFWKNIQDMFFEPTKYDNIPSFNQQFLKVVSFVMENENINDKFKKYVQNKNKNKKLRYVKEYWGTYKPYIDNKIVAEINANTNNELKSIQNYLLKVSGEYTYSNISSIRTFKDAYLNPRFKYLKIPFSEIMKNESYERLFKYSMQLHGKSKSIPIINLHIQRLINTIKDEQVKGLLSNIGWNQSFKKTNENIYSDFRKLFAVDLIRHFQTKNKEDSDTIKIYFHFNVNNWNGFLLNSHPKRNYSYVQPIIYPEDSFESLMTTDDDKNFINEIFLRYCVNQDGEINPRYNNDDFITNILADPSIEREVLCENNITKTKANFDKILEYKREQTSLPIVIRKTKDKSVESRIKYYIRNNNYLEREYDDLFPQLRKLAYDRRCCSDKDLRTIFSDISKHNSYMMNVMQDFYNNHKYISKEHNDRFKLNFGRNITSLSVLVTRMLEKPDKIPGMINKCLQLMGRLSTNERLNESIPKNWKLSDTNTENLKDFFRYNELLSHYNLFTPIKQKINEGYYKYQLETNNSICFKGLLNYIKKYFQKDFSTIVGSDTSQITKEYSNIFNRYIFLFFFNIIIEYINDLEDDESTISTQTNILFASLQEQDTLEKEDKIKICTSFSFDLLVDLIEEYTDTNWIYQSELLNDKLSRQKEREKQGIIDTLESRTTESRLVMVQQQTCGISNYFHQATQKNLSYIQSEEYKNKLGDERSDFAKEFFSQHSSELEVMESEGVNTDMLYPDQSMTQEQQEVQEGYDQIDSDRELEGDDEGDEDGDYREN